MDGGIQFHLKRNGVLNSLKRDSVLNSSKRDGVLNSLYYNEKIKDLLMVLKIRAR